MIKAFTKSIVEAVVGKRPAEIRVLMVGLDAAGKTSFLYRVKLGEVITTIPTIGFNVESVTYKNIEMTAWDVGSRDRIRPLWRHYYQNTKVILFVVDSSDRERMSQVKDELERVYVEDELRDAIFVILANKQDLPNAMRPEEIIEQLALRQMRQSWALFPTSMTSGEGISDVMDWLNAVFENPANLEKKTTPPTRYGSTQIAMGVGMRTEEMAKVVLSTSVENDPLGWNPDASHRKMLSLLPAASLTDDGLLAALREGTLTASQYTHEVMIRCMWIHLKRLSDRSKGRQGTVDAIMKDIRTYSERISQIYHMTHTYFWLQLVDLSLQLPDKTREKTRGGNVLPIPAAASEEGNPDLQPYLEFLQTNPWLLDHQLMSRYYSHSAVFSDPEAFTVFKLPDLKSLPSIISFQQAVAAH